MTYLTRQILYTRWVTLVQKEAIAYLSELSLQRDEKMDYKITQTPEKAVIKIQQGQLKHLKKMKQLN